MSDENVTGQGATPPPAQTTPPPETKQPEKTPESTPSLTREEVAEIFREQFDSLVPDLSQKLQSALGGKFADKEEVARVTQSAGDKAFARAMKQLSPQLKGIDKLIQMGRLSKEDGEAAKLSLLSDSAASFAEPEEEQKPAQPAPPPVTTPTAAQRNWEQDAAESLMQESGLTWDDVTPDLTKFSRSMRRNMRIGEFTKLVAKKVAEKEQQTIADKAKREYEAQSKAVREADKAGATTPPPQGAAAGVTHTPKPTLDDADDLGELLFKALTEGKLPTRGND